MGLIDLYVSRASTLFGGMDADKDEAQFIYLGVPFDSTASYKPGTRFAPNAVREAAANIEFYSPRVDVDIEHVKIHDIGNVVTYVDPVQQITATALVVETLLKESPGKGLIVVGGEHTITYGVVKGILAAEKRSCLVVLDAHFDLRDEYMGHKYSHASVLRRITEELLDVSSVIVAGARAYVQEEKRYAASKGLRFVSVLEIRRNGLDKALKLIDGLVEGRECSHIHLSVDMDVFDPAYAPGVGNPEPEGLTPTEVFDIVHYLVRVTRRGGLNTSLDIVEANPLVDCNGVTSILAAKLIVEYIAAHVAPGS